MKTNAQKREVSLAEAKAHFRRAMDEASPSRLIAKHPLRSITLASLLGLVIGRRGAARTGLGLAAGLAAIPTGLGLAKNLSLALDVVNDVVKIAKPARKKQDQP